jgi:hypothetical protein
MEIPGRIFRHFIAIQQITHNKGIEVVVFLVRLAILEECVIVDGFTQALFAPAVVQFVFRECFATLAAINGIFKVTATIRTAGKGFIKSIVKSVAFLDYGSVLIIELIAAIGTLALSIHCFASH